MALVQTCYQNGFMAMGLALNTVGAASRASKKALPSPAPSLSPPVVGRAIIGAIKACSQSSYGAHLASAALERGLAESELRHSQGMEFLFANLIQPIQDRLGGPVAAAVAKCCLLGVGPLPLYEHESGCGADVNPSSAAAAAAAHNKYLAETLQLDEGDLAAAPELVACAVLGRLAKLVRSFDADLGPLPLIEQEYLKAYKAARDSATAVIKAADALSKSAVVAAAAAAASATPEAAAATAAAARALAAAAAAAAGAREPDAEVMPDVLLDDANDEFNRFFEQVDVKLLSNMAESFGGVADASTARVETAYSALQASMDRHQAKDLRDAMMLRSLRSGGEGGAPVPVLAAILDAYEAAVKAKHLRCAADLAAAEASAAAADAAAAAASGAAAVAAFAGPAAAPPACTAAAPVAACKKQKKNNSNAKSTNNKKNKKDKNKTLNCAGCCCCRGGGARPAAPAPPAPTEAFAYAPTYRRFFAHWVSFFFFFREREERLIKERTNSVEKKTREKTHSLFSTLVDNTQSRRRPLPRVRAAPSAWPRPRPP
jgi:hypothetical protein